jgi:S-adenosylmethionine:tRNA ribosyltransferase-isomerase
MKTENIHISDYNYLLPDDKIAKFPKEQRDQSKLLVYQSGKIKEDIFYNLPKYLPKNSLMIFNNTKVIQARLHFKKVSGALIEIFLLEPSMPTDYELMFQTKGYCEWLCLIGNLKKWKEGILVKEFIYNGETVRIEATKKESIGTSHKVALKWDNTSLSFAELIDLIGELPIPPYLNRETEESDKTTYQTIYSKINGSVAAPTAGLHFTNNVLQDLDSYGIEREELTLHVGAGTFKPVKSEELSGHDMHTEYISVSKQTLEKLLSYDSSAIAVGTTSVRTLESLYYMGVKLHSNPDLSEQELHITQWEPYKVKSSLTATEAIEEIIKYLDRNNVSTLHSSTQIMIAPGYNYKIVKLLITNFHQPQSTLLLLVSAFVKGNWKTIYDYALAHDFRFLSYGDSSLLIP